MKNRKVYLPVLAFVLIAAALLVFLLTRNNKTNDAFTEKQSAVSVSVQEEVPEEKAKDEAADETAAAEKAQPDDEKEQPFLVQITDNDPSVAYVLVRMPNPIGLLPLPLEGEYSKTIQVTMPDGSESVNVLHMTPNGFRMEDANCEGHDCVNQGEVTLENREERVLWNMVICLPHQLSAELITREEAKQMMK